jgi:hypothetical protein
MESTLDTILFKTLLATLPRGEPVSTAELVARGVSAFRASALARSGWLVHLARGAYMLPGDTLTRDGALAFLTRQMPGLHVGSKTALAWRGVRHNLAFQENLSLSGNKRLTLPAWFTERFAAQYQTTQLFDVALAPDYGLQVLPTATKGYQDFLVSVQERALLELLSDLGKTQTLSEARTLVESLPNLREPVLHELLTHTARIKVVRAAATLALELALPWAHLARQHSDRLGGGKRWLAVTKSGERLDFKRP